MSNISLAVDLAGLKIRNPVMNAAGVLGMNQMLMRRVYESGAGAVVSKSIGPEPRVGHENPTFINLGYGGLNAMGLPNPGVEHFAEEARQLTASGIPLVASFFGSTVEDFVRVARALDAAGADALELNGSCPNVAEEMGMLAADPENLRMVTWEVKRSVSKPLFVKLSPNVTDIGEVAKAAEEGGADAITAVNTLKGMVINPDFKKPVLTNRTGGLSGPALKPVALRCVWEIYQSVGIPIVGCGGVSTGRDAVEYFLAGASAVQIGTAVMHRGVKVFREVCGGIQEYMSREGFTEVGELVGLAHG